jgi:hypothetical protein
LGLPTALGRATKEAFEYMHAGKSQRSSRRLERPRSKLCRKRGAAEICCTSSSDLFYELLLDSKRYVSQDEIHDLELLVGQLGR